MAALRYLQTSVAMLVDHGSAEEARQFQLLAGKLFWSADGMTAKQTQAASTSDNLRLSLFEKVSSYFPPEMTHPSGNLVDLIGFPVDIN